MADDRATGLAVVRSGSIPVNHSYRVSNSTSTTATRFMRVIASPEAPAFVQSQIVVTTADGGTSPTMSVGVSATATELINAASTATAATGGTFLPASNATPKRILTADTDLYFKQGGTPNGAGVTIILITLSSVNTDTTIV